MCSSGASGNRPVVRAVRTQEISKVSEQCSRVKGDHCEGVPFWPPPKIAMDAGNVSPSIPFSPSLAEPGAIAQSMLGAQA